MNTEWYFLVMIKSALVVFVLRLRLAKQEF